MPTHIVDLYNTTVLGKSVQTTISTDTTTNGTGVDMANTDGPVHALVSTGNAGDANTQILVKLQEADTSGGTYSDMSGDLASRTLTASASANDDLAFVLKSDKRTKRYVRVAVVTSGGGTPSVPIAATVIGRKKISHSNTGYVSV